MRGTLVIAGGDVVLPDRVAERHALVIEDDRIVAVTADPPRADTVIDATNALVLPGFVDLHVHGVLGHDVLDGAGAVARVSQALPRFGVTAFCPTSIACAPRTLETFLAEVRQLRRSDGPGARVIGAHLESNFLNSEFRGAQPAEWLLTPTGGRAATDILDVIAAYREAIAIVTMAPDIDGGDALVDRLIRGGLRVSIGHSGATLEQARRAFALGATRVTHLFNRLRPMTQREPGVAGAALASSHVVVELIGDGWHVHPAMLRIVWAAVGAGRVAAITDGTAGSGLPPGSRAVLGGQPVDVGDVARLEDGTVAGSVATMDQVFRRWVEDVGVGVVDAARMCASTPAADAGRSDQGRLVPGALADVVVLDVRDGAFGVRQTLVAGRQAFPT